MHFALWKNKTCHENMQTTDFTTLMAVCSDLRANWIPARLEQVYQLDRYTISLCLRTLTKKIWLDISWHPQAARICIGNPPPRVKDTFTFSEQLRHQLNGYALIKVNAIASWERVIDFQFAKRPTDKTLYHIYVEVIGKYSNIILTDADNQIITVGHQVTGKKSTVRTVETGQAYQIPPQLTGTIPKLTESFESWQERISLIPDRIDKQILKVYRGLSPVVVRGMLSQANLDSEKLTSDLNKEDWQNLYQYWQEWLEVIEKEKFVYGWTKSGYTVLGWNIEKKVDDLHDLINTYYQNQLHHQTWKQLHHQLSQKINNILKKLITKQDIYLKRLTQSDQCEEYRQKADLLMANLHQWQSGMQLIVLNDFETNKPIKIKLEPEKNAIQNAQFLYKQHQKLKRARKAVEPLLAEVKQEIDYLSQVKTAISCVDNYSNSEDLQTLLEIKEELISEQYFEDSQYRKSTQKEESKPHIYTSPSGFDILIGRNNNQNDQLTFRTATDYDLWFHSQEIPGSHVLLRINPGEVADQKDLQFTANLAAYYSQGRESQQIPVVYTKPKSVYKPKGAKPGMVIYKKETIIWGYPQQVE